MQMTGPLRADQPRECARQLLFITSSVGIVFIMLRGHQHGRLVVAYDPETDCKVGGRDCLSVTLRMYAAPTCHAAPANRLLVLPTMLPHTSLGCSGRSTG